MLASKILAPESPSKNEWRSRSQNPGKPRAAARRARPTSRTAPRSTATTSPSCASCSTTRACRNAELAARIGLSAAPTWRRVKWLEQQGYITGYRAEIDRRKIGLGVLAFVRVDAERNNAEATRALEDAIRALPEVVACHYISGAGTFELQVMCTDLDAFSRWSHGHAVQAAEREGPAHQLLAGRGEGRRGAAAGAPAARALSAWHAARR